MFRRIRLFQYRNLSDGEILIDAPEVFLIGENGQGKTNFLESLYILCYGSSFRTKTIKEICRKGETSCSVQGWFESSEEGGRHIQVKIKEGAKSIHLDGTSISDRKDLIEINPCIVFAHDDIHFVSGAPDMQRWFFNQTLSMYDPLFIDALRRYSKVLKMRNKSLKEGNTGILEVLDSQLAEAGKEIQEGRRKTVEAFNVWFSPLFTEVSGFSDELIIEYKPSWKEGLEFDEIRDDLGKRRERDLYLGTTSSGPHRDRFIFDYRGEDYTAIASTGQLRLISLVLRIAQARFYSEKTGKRPILLLDDVLLELDFKRRQHFISLLPEYEQIFYTFLPDEQYQKYRKSETLEYFVENGEIKTA